MSARRGLVHLAEILVDLNNVPKTCSTCFYRAKDVKTGQDVCTRTFVFDFFTKSLYYENTQDAFKKCQGEEWQYDYDE